MNDIKLFEPFFSEEVKQITNEVMNSGQIASGKYINKFESGFSKQLKQKNVVTTADMTSAMFLALYLSGVERGDEVITTPYACMATNSPISTIGATPVWVDVMPNSVFMNPEHLEASITSRTKAVIVYHVAGYVGYIEKIANICKKYGIKLIEDCNNALLATVNNINVGSFGDFAVYSFYPNRQINAFEGGALICKCDNDAFTAKKMRRFGINYNDFRGKNGEINPNSDIPIAGWSCSLNNLCASAAYAQLTSVSGRINKIKNNAGYLAEKLSRIDAVTILSPIEGTEPVYWAFLIFVEERDIVLDLLKKQRVNASILHYRNDKYSCFNKTKDLTLPNIADVQKKIMALPCGWWLEKSDLDKIVDELSRVLEFVNK